MLTPSPPPRAGSAPSSWSTHQLTGFLATVSSAADELTASRLAVERAAEALDAEVAALIRRGEVRASIGFPPDPALEGALVDVATGRSATLVAPGLGECSALALAVEDDTPASLVIARRAEGGFAPDELNLARGMARVLGLSLHMLRLAEQERGQRAEAESQADLNRKLLASLQERQEMLERLSRIQRSIAHAAGRSDVLQAICDGARELLGDQTAALRLLAPDDDSVLETVALSDERKQNALGERFHIAGGLGGRAFTEGRLAVEESYQTQSNVLGPWRDRGVQAGMAAPVHEQGRIVGSLVVASYQPGRRYSAIERDMLTAFADHTSLAMSDSRRIEAMRERDAERIHERYRALVEHSSDLITVLTPDCEILYMSPSAEGMVALGDGTGFADLVHPDDRDDALEVIARAAGEGTRQPPAEWRMRAADGEWRSFETIATGQLDAPDVQGIVLNSRDVTERNRLEAQLRQSQRLESVGQLAGGIAHDFNNFLSVIRGYARFVIDGLPAESPLRSDAEEVARAAERASRLTNQLLVFSRRDAVQTRVLDLADVFAGLQSLLERMLGEHVRMTASVQEGLWRVKADPTQIEQVLANLIVNARDAMPDGGELTVELANEENGAERQVRLTVRDQGAGMDPEVVERAFEPFYSTKPKGEGTGLGLATVYGIVTQAGGRVEIDSTPGEGTAVNVLLPATEAAPQPTPEQAGSPGTPASGETILVVEDEDAVRRLTCRILSGQGYRVLAAGDGLQALDTWREHNGSIDLLLTDVVMPGMSGKELAERLGIVPVFMSGYTDDVMLHHGVEGLRLVEKPFDADTLLSVVRDALDGAPA